MRNTVKLGMKATVMKELIMGREDKSGVADRLTASGEENPSSS